jgi:hypothetical protein
MDVLCFKVGATGKKDREREKRVCLLAGVLNDSLGEKEFVVFFVA